MTGQAPAAVDPFRYMRTFRSPGPKSKAGLAVVAEHEANRRAEQDTALRHIRKALREYDRVQVIAASGSGKTYLAYKLVVSARPAPRVSVVVLPWVELLDQTKKRFAQYLQTDGIKAARYDLTVVCSDKEAKEAVNDFHHISLTDLEERLASDGLRPTIVLTTNASVGKVGAVLARTRRADLVVVDEAHHAAGSADRRTVREIHRLPASKTVFMTATARVVSKRVVNRRSMDDIAAFGPVAYSITFGAAAQQRIIADSVLALLSVEEAEAAAAFDQLADSGFRIPKANVDYFKYEVAAAIATLRSMVEGGLQRVLTFHNTKHAAREFRALLELLADTYGYRNLAFGAVDEDTTDRRQMINDLIGLRHDGRKVDGYVLSSCRVLSEGFDVPAVDGVVVVDPRLSEIDVTQTINRGSRFDSNKPGKRNVVIIPVLGENPIAPDGGRDPKFSTVVRIIDLMRDVDESITGTLYSLAGFQRAQTLDTPVRATPSLITDLPADIARRVSLQLLDPGLTSWMERFEELRMVGEMPYLGYGSGRHRTPLANWVNHQRESRRRGELTESRVALLESLSFWKWRSRPTLEASVMSAYQSDMTAKEIAEAAGISTPAVLQFLRDRGMPWKRVYGKDGPLSQDVMAVYRSDMTLREIADASGRPVANIHQFLRIHGLSWKRALRQPYSPTDLCSVAGCDFPPRSLGKCPLHYSRERANDAFNRRLLEAAKETP